MLASSSYPRVDRTIGPGEHPFAAVIPEVARSPALKRISSNPKERAALLKRARVLVCGTRGYAFVDVEAPRIIVSESYFRGGADRDLYLDLLHELTHLRQLREGFDLWDERFDYVDRPTEVEAYAVAVEEGRRLGMSDPEILEYLKNPWTTKRDVARLLGHIDRFLGGQPLPNVDAALDGAPFRIHYPWRCPKRPPAQPRRPRRGAG